MSNLEFKSITAAANDIDVMYDNGLIKTFHYHPSMENYTEGFDIFTVTFTKSGDSELEFLPILEPGKSVQYDSDYNELVFGEDYSLINTKY